MAELGGPEGASAIVDDGIGLLLREAALNVARGLGEGGRGRAEKASQGEEDVVRRIGAKRSIRSRLSSKRSLRKSKTISLTPSLAKAAMSPSTSPVEPEKGRRSPVRASRVWVGS